MFSLIYPSFSVIPNWNKVIFGVRMMEINSTSTSIMDIQTIGVFNMTIRSPGVGNFEVGYNISPIPTGFKADVIIWNN